MKLLIRNLLRNPVRTLLTVLGAALALFLYCFVETVIFAFNAGPQMADASRLVVQHKESITFPLPASYRRQIEALDGVTGVCNWTWFGATYEEPTPDGGRHQEFFAQFAVDIADLLPMYPEMEVPQDRARDLLADRSGCLIGDKLAERLGKKIGDRIVLGKAIWERADGKPWSFTIRATYTSRSPSFDRTMMFFDWAYLDEGRWLAKGTKGSYVVRIADPNRYAAVSAAIDERFANSPDVTRTMTEKAFNMQFVAMMGNLELLFRTIGAVVVFAMLLISANTMMMSARERTREMAVLKAIGFTDAYVFRLLAGEAMAIAMLGALLGAGGSFLLIDVFAYNPKPDFFPIFHLPLESLAAAFAVALLTGLVSGIVPAVSGWRLNAVEALRSV